MEEKRVTVHLLSQSQKMIYTQVKNTYTKDGLFCILLESGIAHKFPLVNIFRITDNYE